MLKVKLLLPSIIMSTFLITGWAYSDTIIVNNLGNSGDGSLRWAMEKANINSGPDTIRFNVSGTISPTSFLPAITDDETVIDASSQWVGEWPEGKPGITLDGGNDVDGLLIDGADQCHIRGLYITNFVESGVSISGAGKFNTIGGTGIGYRNVISGNDGYGVVINAADSNVVSGNYIGTDVSGTVDLGNSEDGVYITEGAQSNTIGGTTAGERNIISGNDKAGALILGSGTNSNVVSGNYIGTDVNGTTYLGNFWHGVFIAEGAQSNTIGGTSAGERNIISGNNHVGVVIYGSGTNSNVVSGNYIGTDVNGTTAMGNLYRGVVIAEGAQSNTIGGTSAGEKNIISGNGFMGVRILGSGTNSNVVSGNYIGTDVNGTTAMGNVSYGVSITEGAQSNTIGGTTAGERNIISGNGADGIAIHSSGTNSNVISGNYIGTDVSGFVALGNSRNGVVIDISAQSNTIGGTGNTIAFNGDNGVVVDGINADYNKISKNSIHDNAGLGIDLVDDGNDEIHVPTITSAVLIENMLNIEGTIAGANAMVEIFETDSFASGEGMTYLGSLTADGSGNFSGDIDVTEKELAAGDLITSTTTHTDNNTSEFSLPTEIAGTTVPDPDIKANNSDGPVNLTFGGTLFVTIALDPGDYPGYPADWWCVADAPFGWYYYNGITETWQPGFQVSYQGPLGEVSPPLEVLNISDLPTGSYTFYFGVDGNRNGNLDEPYLYYDSVAVNITP